MKPRIAIIDDEQRMVDIITMLLSRKGYAPTGFAIAESAIAAMEEQPFDLVLTDLRMPGMDGIEVLERMRAIDDEVPIILMTAYADVKTALAAMKAGAFDYVQKPFDNTELDALITRALEVTRLARENRYLRAELAGQHNLHDIIAESDAMKNVLGIVRRVAKSTSTVLISGDSGTGKEMLARAVHYHSDRVGKPFVAANCKAFAESVLESELFGHEKGAFTGAESTRAGLFERADGGSLFLDEIGEVNESFQAKLLRVLQERVIQRVGGSEEHAVDVRVIAATNKDLKAEVEAGRFREDLYFRLNVIPIRIRPLIERKEDILPLARHFLARTNEDQGRSVTGWSDEVEATLLAYPWPGNVRELANTIERAVVLAATETIVKDDLLLDDSEGRTSAAVETGLSLPEFLDHAASERIRHVLEQCDGSRKDAAVRLGIERTTLYRLMKKYRIS